MSTLVIRHGDVRCKVLRGNFGMFRDAAQIENPEAEHAGSKFISFYDLRTKTFPSGLLRQIVDEAKSNGHKVVVKRKKRRKVVTKHLRPDMLWNVSMDGKYDYQFDILKTMLKHERCRIRAATNAGKGVLIAATGRTLYDEFEMEGLVVVPSNTLVEQTSKEVAEYTGLKTGKIGGGSKTTGIITVATAQSLIRGVPEYVAASKDASRRSGKRSNVHFNQAIYDLLQRVGWIIVDESQFSSAMTWRYLLETCPARFRFGVSGTPDTRDAVRDFTTLAYLGPTIEGVRNKELQQRGVSAKVYCYCIYDPRAAPRRMPGPM